MWIFFRISWRVWSRWWLRLRRGGERRLDGLNTAASAVVIFRMRLLLLFAVCAAFGQSVAQPVFEVVSVKPTPPSLTRWMDGAATCRSPFRLCGKPALRGIHIPNLE
jgi:hypothetical protein